MKTSFRTFLSLFLLVVPAFGFALVLFAFSPTDFFAQNSFLPLFAWQVYLLIIAGTVATIGGWLDWRYHRNPLNMKIPKKERDAEAKALGLGGVPMFILMCIASFSDNPTWYLIPIILLLIYTVVLIAYDEFVFHIKRCGKQENIYHRMLVFGNGIAWLSWFHLIYI